MGKNKDTFEEKLRKDAGWYESDKYKQASEKEKLRRCSKTAKMIYDHVIKNGLHVKQNGTIMTFRLSRNRHKNLGVRAEDLGLFADGCFEYGVEKDPFIMNRNQLNDGKNIREQMFHEPMHMLQEELCGMKNNYTLNQPEYNYLLTIESNITPIQKPNEYQLFGFQISGQCYVSCKPCGVAFIDSLTKSLYSLMCIERYAYQTTKKYKDIIVSDPNCTDRCQIAASIIKDQYNCNYMSYQDVCELIDSASRNIYTGHEPTNKLEAMVMYDMAAILAYQHGHIELNEYSKAMEVSSRVSALAQYQYEHKIEFEAFNITEITDHLDVLTVLDRTKMDQLSIGERINNPSLMLQAIYYYGKEGAELIPDRKILLDWCRLNIDTIDKEVLHEAAQILGEEFSPESCRKYVETQQKIKAALEHWEQNKKQAHAVNSNKYVEEYDFDYDPHLATKDEYSFERN